MDLSSNSTDIKAIVSEALLQQAQALDAKHSDTLAQQAAQFEAIVGGLQSQMANLLTQPQVLGSSSKEAKNVKQSQSSNNPLKESGQKKAVFPAGEGDKYFF
ncbi:hypothetical protein BY996DRAFT_6426364 [Phakopsora pachyrhizi]|nr:hypothetical protein BY996DRAFT_6426364 [Phakopsora pachyrhizi]